MTDCELILGWKQAVCAQYGSESTRCLGACAIYELECEESAAPSSPEQTAESIMKLEALSFQMVADLKTPPEIQDFIKLAVAARDSLAA